MKRSFYFFACLVCTLPLFTMCNLENEPSMVNNPNSLQHEQITQENVNLEEWTKANSQILQNYNYEKIGMYPKEVQKAILNSFSPEKRKSIWQSKLNYLQESSEFSKEEKEYFNWFNEKFAEVTYEKAMSKELSQELYDKALDGIEKFGWSKAQVYRMFFTVESLSNSNKEQIKSELIKAPKAYQSGVDCECYYDLGCPTWDCDSGNGCNSKNDSFDCGVFGGTDCDGTC